MVEISCRVCSLTSLRLPGAPEVLTHAPPPEGCLLASLTLLLAAFNKPRSAPERMQEYARRWSSMF